MQMEHVQIGIWSVSRGGGGCTGCLEPVEILPASHVNSLIDSAESLRGFSIFNSRRIFLPTMPSNGLCSSTRQDPREAAKSWIAGSHRFSRRWHRSFRECIKRIESRASLSEMRLCSSTVRQQRRLHRLFALNQTPSSVIFSAFGRIRSLKRNRSGTCRLDSLGKLAPREFSRAPEVDAIQSTMWTQFSIES